MSAVAWSKYYAKHDDEGAWGPLDEELKVIDGLDDAIKPFLPSKKTRLEVECPVCGEPTRVECASCTWSRAVEAGEGE